MSNDLQAIFFDFDGTLVNSDVLHFDFWSKLLASKNIKMDKELYGQCCVGCSTANAAKNLAVVFPGLKISPEELISAKENHYLEWVQNGTISLMPGVKEILTFVKTLNLPIAIVTSSYREEVLSHLEKHQLQSYFDIIVGRGEVTHLKPSPDLYLCALDRLKVKADKVVSLEDTALGSRAAKAAGIITCVIPHEFTKNQSFEHCDKICESMFEVMNWIQEKFFPQGLH